MNETSCNCPLCRESATKTEYIVVQCFRCSECGEFIFDIDMEVDEMFDSMNPTILLDIRRQIKDQSKNKVLKIGLECGTITYESEERSEYNVVGLPA